MAAISDVQCEILVDGTAVDLLSVQAPEPDMMEMISDEVDLPQDAESNLPGLNHTISVRIPASMLINEMADYAHDVLDMELTTDNVAQFVETDIRDNHEPLIMFLELIQSSLRPKAKRRLFGLLPGVPTELPAAQWLWTSVTSVRSEGLWVVLEGTCDQIQS